MFKYYSILHNLIAIDGFANARAEYEEGFPDISEEHELAARRMRTISHLLADQFLDDQLFRGGVRIRF